MLHMSFEQSCNVDTILAMKANSLLANALGNEGYMHFGLSTPNRSIAVEPRNGRGWGGVVRRSLNACDI